MLSRTVTRKRRGRRPLTAIAIISVVAGLALATGSVLAVHDEDFELDGNTVVNTGLPLFDWNSFFNADGEPSPELPDASRPGFDSSGFENDFVTNANGTFNTSDTSTFATGSKDTLPITPGWQCSFSSNVNSKTDVMNAYAVQFTDPVSGDEILYFGLERNANTGTGNVGFWFLQDDNVACESPSGNTAFTGDHVDGDILIVSEFSNGGAVATIQAYKWEGGADGALNPQSVAEGASCSSALAGDSICASVNTATITVPWDTANKQDGVGNSLRVSEFFEAGLNLTDEGLGGKCFATFTGVTRSSTSLTATIFDYALGELGSCETTLETDAGDTDNGGIASPTSIGDGSVSSGTDTATLTITGADEWAGELTFYLCGPDSSLTSCDKDLGYQVGTGTTVDETSSGADFVSGDVQITSAGTYCWTAHFEPDEDTAAAGVGPGDDDGTNECFTVDPVTPTLTTDAGDTVTLGQAVTDTAELSGAATEPGTNGTNTNYPSIGATDLAYAGTIEFTLKGPSDTGCGSNATGTGTNPQTVNVDTVVGNKVYGPVSFTPDAVGNFHWQATYTNTGSANNTSPVTHNADCDEAAEDVEVTGSAAFTTEQNWLPNDSATVTAPAGTTLNGTLSFTLYDTADCTGNVLYDESFTITAGAPGGTTRTTTNGTNPADTFVAEASDHVSWLVEYDDTTLNDPADSCKEDTNLIIDNTNDPAP